jgi:hypothetical protein
MTTYPLIDCGRIGSPLVCTYSRAFRRIRVAEPRDLSEIMVVRIIRVKEVAGLLGLEGRFSRIITHIRGIRTSKVIGFIGAYCL